MKRDFLEKKKISPKPLRSGFQTERICVWSSSSVTPPPHAHLSSCNSPLKTRALQSAPRDKPNPWTLLLSLPPFHFTDGAAGPKTKEQRLGAIIGVLQEGPVAGTHCTTWPTDSDFKIRKLHHFSFIAELQQKRIIIITTNVLLCWRMPLSHTSHQGDRPRRTGLATPKNNTNKTRRYILVSQTYKTQFMNVSHPFFLHTRTSHTC